MIETKYYVNGKEFTNYEEAKEYEYLWYRKNSPYKIGDIVYYISTGTIFKSTVKDIVVSGSYIWYYLLCGTRKKEDEIFRTPEELCENLKNNIFDYQKNGTA